MNNLPHPGIDEVWFRRDTACGKINPSKSGAVYYPAVYCPENSALSPPLVFENPAAVNSV